MIRIEALLWATFAGGCSSVDEAKVTGDAAAEAERVEGVVREDFDRVRTALEKHAASLAQGLGKTEPDAKRATIYRAFAPWRQTTAGGRAVFDLQTAPVLFLGVVDAEGKLVVRDRQPEKSYREDLRARFPSVGKALRGDAALSHGTLPGGEGEVILLAVPVPGESGVVGAIVAPFGYGALARRLERQRTLEANRTKGGVVKAPTIRVALFAGRSYVSGSIQPELDPTRPTPRQRTKKLGTKGSYVEYVPVQSRPFGLAVRKFGFLEGNADVGIVVWRSDPVPL